MISPLINALEGTAPVPAPVTSDLEILTGPVDGGTLSVNTRESEREINKGREGEKREREREKRGRVGEKS
jgi:hypothetical protein